MTNITRAILASLAIWTFGLCVALIVDGSSGFRGWIPSITIAWGLYVAYVPKYVDGDWFGRKWRERFASVVVIAGILFGIGLVIHLTIDLKRIDPAF